jgi:hypothetical protein
MHVITGSRDAYLAAVTILFVASAADDEMAQSSVVPVRLPVLDSLMLSVVIADHKLAIS